MAWKSKMSSREFHVPFKKNVFHTLLTLSGPLLMPTMPNQPAIFEFLLQQIFEVHIHHLLCKIKYSKYNGLAQQIISLSAQCWCNAKIIKKDSIKVTCESFRQCQLAEKTAKELSLYFYTKVKSIDDSETKGLMVYNEKVFKASVYQ